MSMVSLNPVLLHEVKIKSIILYVYPPNQKLLNTRLFARTA